MRVEDRIAELGIQLPDMATEGFSGSDYGPMKPHHLVGNVLQLSGHTPTLNGAIVHPGRLGGTLTIEEGYEAARVTGLNAIAGMKYALDDLDRVKGIIRCMCFVACEPDFTDVHKVSTGLSDILREVFGDQVGTGCRATIGVQTLADNMCFETLMEIEVHN